MKFKLLYAAAALLAASCSYDDSALSERVDDLDARVSNIETWMIEVNNNLSALRTTVEALQNQDYIESVTPTATGWDIVFHNSGKITVYQGTAGTDGTPGYSPVIGVVLDNSDGIWYWTLDGNAIIVDGKKVPASSVTPQIKIEEGVFKGSYDGGATWTELGPATNVVTAGKVINDVRETATDVTFVTEDGTVEIVIPKGSTFGLTVDTNEVAIAAGASLDINYTVLSPDSATKVDAIANGGVTVAVIPSSTDKGVLRITQGATAVSATVWLVAKNAAGKAAMQIITVSAE